MSSRAPLAKKPSWSQPLADSTANHSIVTEGSATKQLLARIADALQVSPATLYNPPNAVDLTVRPRSTTAASEEIEGESAALLHAFQRIRDPKERRRILTLVQETAEPV